MRFLPLAVGVVVLFLSGCGEEEDGLDSDDPRTVVATYMEALEEKDAATACEVIAAEYGVKPQRCVSGLTRAFETRDVPGEFDAEADLGELSFGGEDTARVEILTTGGYVDLVRENGEWRIQLSD